jgi:hypothetical protein
VPNLIALRVTCTIRRPRIPTGTSLTKGIGHACAP